MDIEFTENPLESNIQYLTKNIDAETPEYGTVTPFAFYLRNNDLIIAGCNGYILYGVRHKGLAKKLIHAAFEYGLEKNCTIATVKTMSFQNAQEFYFKLGFEQQFEQSGYHKNSTSIFYSKNLI